MAFDPKQHEKDQKRYLDTLLDAVEKAKAESPNVDETCVTLTESEIASLSGLPRPLVDRISDELSREGLIELFGGLGAEIGRSYSLSLDGLTLAQTNRYEKTPLAKRRKLMAWAGESAKELSKSVWSNALSGAGGVIAGWLLGYHWKSMVAWLSHLLGK